ncbi:hypothetical protein J6A31_07475 [bacterium]|nr:hypothetical protein [bacterium]
MFDFSRISNFVMLMDEAANTATGDQTAVNWSFNSLINNLESALGEWGKIIVTIIGLVMVIVGVFNIGKGLMSGGRGQTNWVLNIALFLIGGILAFGGGWSIVQGMGQGAKTTLDDLAANSTATNFIVVDANFATNTMDCIDIVV